MLLSRGLVKVLCRSTLFATSVYSLFVRLSSLCGIALDCCIVHGLSPCGFRTVSLVVTSMMLHYRNRYTSDPVTGDLTDTVVGIVTPKPFPHARSV